MRLSTYFNRYIIIFCTLLFAFCHESEAQLPTPKHEVRAVWLTTIGGLDWPHSYSQSSSSAKHQQKELCDILDKLKAANVNTVLIQARVRGTTIYPSQYEPWDGCLSGMPGISPGYDALKFAIDECHKRGMELHAWVVTIPVGKWNKLGCKKLRAKYPSMIRKIGDEGYMNPERKETADYLAKICGEITRNYDVDGIHLDYIRYPETWNARINREQGRRNITRIVSRIHDTVKSIKPWVKMSCSPIGKFDDLVRYESYGWNAYTKVCQNAQGWLRNGLMDELFPMMYFRGNQFFPFALDWKENSYGKIISVGLGIYFLSPQEKDWDIDVIKREMNVLRQQGLGHAYFRSKFFTDNIKGVYDFALQLDNHPALIPAMTWASSAIPTPPTTLTVNHTDSGDDIEWSGARDMSDGPYLMYNIYASTDYPVDVNDARNLVAARYIKQSISISRDAGKPTLHYAITATDRYGNESKPICSPSPKDNGYQHKSLLKNNGQTLTLPAKGNTLDANYVIIETLQGSIVDTKPYADTTISISNLPEGMYVLKSLGRKGVTHRLGFLIIRR